MRLYILYVAAIVLACSCYIHGVNVALGKETKQSSTKYPYSTSDKAVDGNDNKNFYSRTCMQTQCNDDDSSWCVDLVETYDITSITIANPTQSHGRLKNIKIEIYKTSPCDKASVPETCTTIGQTPQPDGVNVILNCTNTLTGRYVKITKTALETDPNRRCDSLLLCEVLVEGILPDQNVCAKGFIKHGGSCYHFSTDVGGQLVRGSWYDARVACRSMRADLAILDSEAENNFVKTKLKDAQKYWLGAQDFADGETWEWADPDAQAIPGFEDWRAGQPDDPTNKNCVALVRDGQWRWENQGCRNKLHYVCEKSPTWPK